MDIPKFNLGDMVRLTFERTGGAPYKVIGRGYHKSDHSWDYIINKDGSHGRYWLTNYHEFVLVLSEIHDRCYSACECHLELDQENIVNCYPHYPNDIEFISEFQDTDNAGLNFL
jgi:hypothetical protein